MKINLMTIFRESADEIRKVVWLNKAEQLKKNLAVIGLVSVMTLLIWGLDRGFEYLFYGQLLHLTP